MTDQDLVQMLRCCGRESEDMDCDSCIVQSDPDCCAKAFLCAASRLEKLVAENETLKMGIAYTNSSLWHPASEPPQEAGKYLCRVESFAFPGNFYQEVVFWGEYGFYRGNLYYNVSHWVAIPDMKNLSQ